MGEKPLLSCVLKKGGEREDIDIPETKKAFAVVLSCCIP
jgi:hypothetical protein